MGMRDQVIGVAMDEFHEIHSVIEFARRLELEEAARHDAMVRYSNQAWSPTHGRSPGG